MNGRVEVVRAYHRWWATKNYRAKHAIRVLPSFGKKKKEATEAGNRLCGIHDFFLAEELARGKEVRAR